MPMGNALPTAAKAAKLFDRAYGGLRDRCGVDVARRLPAWVIELKPNVVAVAFGGVSPITKCVQIALPA